MAQKSISIIMALLLIAAGSIYYFSEDSASETENRKGGPHVDSLSADNRPSITARRDTVPEPVGEDLPPGTALIRTTLLSVEETEGEEEITVQVEEVLGYGSSTPPITTDTQFTFAISHYLEQNADLKDHLSVDEQIEILVSYQEGIQTADSDKKQRWSFVELHPINDE